MAKQKAITAVNSLIIKDNKVLLLKRANTGYCDGMYGVPAGHIDDLELGSTAMLRELKEEISLNLKPTDIKQVCTVHKLQKDCVYIHYFFKISNFNIQDIKNNEPNKCDELAWFDLDNLPENTQTYVKKAIETVLKGESFFEDDFSYLTGE